MDRERGRYCNCLAVYFKTSVFISSAAGRLGERKMKTRRVIATKC
jgi:hypothetical protein